MGEDMRTETRRQILFVFDCSSGNGHGRVLLSWKRAGERELTVCVCVCLVQRRA